MVVFDEVKQHGPKTIIEKPRERAVLVGVERPDQEWTLESSLAELERLAWTAGADMVAKTSQRLDSPNPRTFVGSGKAEEIASLARSYAADVVIFDDELTPSQQSNLESIVGKDVKVIDRTALILDIFALHATSKEGRLQVRLAQNQYLYPRLRGMWAHLASNRMGGGVGSRFGEGESQLEVDRRLIRNRITSIRRDLANLSKKRDLQRKRRNESGVFKIALAGYTNAGKSSLLNALTGSEVLSYDKLFATLDSTTRQLTLPEGREVTLTDTVGFIQKLPTTLVEAFKSTLDEINGASLVLHVVDASDPNAAKQIDTVNMVLEQIGAEEIGRIEVFNKKDLLSAEQLEALQARYPHAVFTSTVSREGLHELISRIGIVASAQDEVLELLIPFSRGDLVSMAHQRCTIINEDYNESGTHLVVRAGHQAAAMLKPFSCEAK